MRATAHFVAAVLLGAVMANAGCGMDSMMPNPPSDLMVVEVAGGAHLTWKDNSDNEASFMIERKAGTGNFEPLATVPFDTTAYHDAPLMVGTTYKYRVMAAPKSGEHSADTKYSNEVTFMLAMP